MASRLLLSAVQVSVLTRLSEAADCCQSPASQEVGTFKLLGSDDLKHAHNEYVQLADGTITGERTYDNIKSTYEGGILQASCSMRTDGKMDVVLGWWWADSEEHSGDEARIECTYKVWQDGAKPKVVSKVAYRDPGLHSKRQFIDGTFAGACPLTAAEAKKDIKWMPSPMTDVNSKWGCQENCGDFVCNQDSSDAVSLQHLHVVMGVLLLAPLWHAWQ